MRTPPSTQRATTSRSPRRFSRRPRETDRLEDERYGEKRGDELPPELSTEQGRRAWLREAKRRLDEKRAAEAEPIPRSRPERLRSQSAGSRRSTRSSATRTLPMRPTVRAG